MIINKVTMRYLSMKHFSPVYHLRCRCGAWWLNRKFEAITLFGTIFFNCAKSELSEKLRSPALLRTERHEHIHILQARSFRTRYLGFYLFYVGWWLRNLLKYHNAMKAYYEIPFEREAYANENLHTYNQSHWRDYRPAS